MLARLMGLGPQALERGARRVGFDGTFGGPALIVRGLFGLGALPKSGKFKLNSSNLAKGLQGLVAHP